MSTSVTAPSRAARRPERVAGTARLARPAGRRDLVVGAALAIALFLIGIFAAGGTELAANTWVQVALVVMAATAAFAVVACGAAGPRWGAGSLAAFAALAALTYASLAWSVQPATSWLEANRTLSYLAAFGTALALARLFPRRWPALVGAVAATTTAISVYAIVLKIFPGSFDRIAQLGRLIEPLDYWNAIGLVSAMGIAPCLWLGARAGGPRVGKALAPAAIALLITTLLLSYSRGALIVAVIGAAFWFATVPLRLRGALVLGIGILGGAAASAFGLSNHSLTADYVPLAKRVSAGHWLGLVVLLVLGACIAAGWIAGDRMERVVLPARVRRRVSTGLVVVVALLPVGGLVALATSSRGFTGQVSHLWNSATNTAGGTGDQPGRLVKLSNSRPHYWSEAITVGKHHLLLGSGALGFALANRVYSQDTIPVGHAHSYVVQTFADLGLVGLTVSVVLLVGWITATRRTLRSPPGAPPSPERIGMLTLLSVVLIFGLHSLIDWTWFVPATAVVALVCAGWLAGRGPLSSSVGLSQQARRVSAEPAIGLFAVGLIAATVFAVWAIVQPLRSANADSAAITALTHNRGAVAASQAREAAASDPLAVEPLFLLGQIYSDGGNSAQARAELLRATSIQPQNPDTWERLGDFDVAQHQYRIGLVELQRANVLIPYSIRLANEVRHAQALVAQSG